MASTKFLPSLAITFLFSLSIHSLHENHLCNAKNNQDEVPKVPLNDAEREALMKIYNNIPHTTKKFIWDFSQPACSWKGVYCFSDDKFTTVLHLRFPGKSFVGEIPLDTIGKLTSLRVLSLRENGFYGSIPYDFSNLKSLTRLTLNNNRFNGSIPSFFSTFTKLNVLLLNNNSFSGELPNIKAKGLEKFDVSFNMLNSRIPHLLSKFPISNFRQNVFLCDAPTNNKCNGLHPVFDEHEKKEKNKPVILGISIGSGLLLLVLLWCVRKKVDHQTKRPLLKADVEGENSFVLFDNDRIRMLDMEDLLNASAVVLGSGSVGRSYKRVIEGENATVVVVKRLKNVVVTENEFRKTMEGLGKMKNKNVVTLIAYYYSRYEKWIIYDYIPGGSLYARLHGSISSGRRQLNWDHRMKIALSSARGLEYLHAQNIIHGNIKSSNILIQQETNNEASVADYGLNTLFHGSTNNEVTGYGAVEVLNIPKVSVDADVYSFGVLLLEILTAKIPKRDLEDKKGVPFSKWVESIVCKEPRDVYDVELRMEHNNIEEMMQLFDIAKGCVSSVSDQQTTTMQVVVSKMENMWFRPSSDDRSSKGYDDTPSTEARDTPSTITP